MINTYSISASVNAPLLTTPDLIQHELINLTILPVSFFFFSGKKRKTQRSTRGRTGEHDDGRFGKAELVDEEVPHALGVVDASLELVPGEPVRDSDDHGLLAAVWVRRWAWRRVVVRGRGKRGRVGGRGGLWREGAWVSDEGDSVAEGAADGSGARWHLQRRSAVGAVHQQVAVHGCGW